MPHTPKFFDNIRKQVEDMRSETAKEIIALIESALRLHHSYLWNHLSARFDTSRLNTIDLSITADENVERNFCPEVVQIVKDAFKAWKRFEMKLDKNKLQVLLSTIPKADTRQKT